MVKALRNPLAFLLIATGFAVSDVPLASAVEPSGAGADLLRVAQDWRHRVFVVLADGGPARPSVSEMEKNPDALFRKRRVGCAVFLGTGRFLLTTASVTAGGTEVEIFDGNGHHTLARVVGADPFVDLALLEAVDRLPGTDHLDPLTFDVEPAAGDSCLLLGSAYGHELSATVGRVGGSIEIEPGGVPTRAHRIEAPIYPGDSGAPVLDSSGRLLGIITGASRPGRHPVREEVGEMRDPSAEPPAGLVGFAVPARECRRAWMDLRDFGYVRRGYLGVRIAAQTKDSGAQVLNVAPGGPAATAGLLPGDIVTRFGDMFVRDAKQFCAVVVSEEPFRSVPMRVLRDGREHVLTVEVGVAAQLPRLTSMNLEDLGHPLSHPSRGKPNDEVRVVGQEDSR